MICTSLKSSAVRRVVGGWSSFVFCTLQTFLGLSFDKLSLEKENFPEANFPCLL